MTTTEHQHTRRRIARALAAALATPEAQQELARLQAHADAKKVTPR